MNRSDCHHSETFGLISALNRLSPEAGGGGASPHCSHSSDSAARVVNYFPEPPTHLFLTLWQLEGEALEELVHEQLFAAPPASGVLGREVRPRSGPTGQGRADYCPILSPGGGWRVHTHLVKALEGEVGALGADVLGQLVVEGLDGARVRDTARAR